VIFDHTVRVSSPGSKHPPVHRVHIDQTRKSVEGRVKSVMGGEGDRLLEKRFRLVNVWRPLKGPVVSFPLGMADSQSIPGDDLVEVEHRYVSVNNVTVRLGRCRSIALTHLVAGPPKWNDVSC
jgi:hypothetical protein